MVRRLFRYLLASGLLVAAVLLVRRTVHLRDEVTRVVPSRDRWTPVPAPATAPMTALATEPVASAASIAVASPPRDDEAAAAEPHALPLPDEETAPASVSWLPPVDGGCPPTHPIKAKAASGIYHLPGMVHYERTKPDRCYAEESAAVTDGFAKAKR